MRSSKKPNGNAINGRYSIKARYPAEALKVGAHQLPLIQMIDTITIIIARALHEHFLQKKMSIKDAISIIGVYRNHPPLAPNSTVEI